MPLGLYADVHVPGATAAEPVRRAAMSPATAQAPAPLQELMPEQYTSPPVFSSAAIAPTAPLNTNPAAADARAHGFGAVGLDAAQDATVYVLDRGSGNAPLTITGVAVETLVTTDRCVVAGEVRGDALRYGDHVTAAASLREHCSPRSGFRAGAGGFQ